MDMERKTLNIEIKSLDERGTFQGLLSVYDVIDECGDVVERGAYTKTLQENSGKLTLLWQHNQELPIGTLEVSDGADGLEVKGSLLLSDDVPQAKTAYALLKAGVIRGLSIGFRTMRKKVEDKVRRLKEIKLYEGSLVTIPANRFALVSDVKSLVLESKDFSADLETIRLMDSHYQIMGALRSALWKIIHDKKLKADEKTDAAGESIDQFRAAFMGFLPQYLAAMEDSGDSMYYMSAEDAERKFLEAPDVSRSALNEFCKKITDLAGKHPGTSQDAASAAPQEPEPEALPSELKSFFDSWKEKLQAIA